MRYDAGWQRISVAPRANRYDQNFRPGLGGAPNTDRQMDRSWSGSGGTAGTESSMSVDLYGPARYGLGPYHARLRQRRRADDELKAEVEDALFYDTWVDAEAITVDAKDGIVTLRGELPNYEEIRYATDDAWDVAGVIGVRSELSVRRS